MSLLNQDNKDSKIKLPDVDMTQVAGKATEVAGKAGEVAGEVGKVAGQAAGKAVEVVKGIDFAQILENIWTVIKAIFGGVFGFVWRFVKARGFYGTLEAISLLLFAVCIFFYLVVKDINTSMCFGVPAALIFVFVQSRKNK